MNSPRIWGSAAAVALVWGLSSFLGAGCVEPQRGTVRGKWCGEDSVVMVVDDMEDGDDVSCRMRGRWSVTGSGSQGPKPVLPLKPIDLTGDDLMVRSPSVRAMYLSGTIDPGGTAALFVSMKSTDLTPYREIPFWARADEGELDFRVNVVTAATTDAAAGGTCDSTIGACGNHFGDPTKVGMAWTSFGTPLVGLPPPAIGQTTTSADLEHTLGIEFLVSAPPDAPKTFGLWIDDVQLRKGP